METDTINLGIAILASGFWVPVGILLILKRNALQVLASVPIKEVQGLPKVSVVIPARNEERNLKQALQSVLRLEYPELEIVVVNDRSRDGTAGILEEISKTDSRLTLLNIESLPPVCSPVA